MFVSRQMMDDVLPARDVRIRIAVPDNHRVTRVYLAPEMKELPFELEGREAVIRVPEVGIYQMIVLDFQRQSESGRP